VRRIHVDFNNIVGSVVPVPVHGETFVVGEAVIVFDSSTDDYAGRIIGVSGSTTFIEVAEILTSP